LANLQPDFFGLLLETFGKLQLKLQHLPSQVRVYSGVQACYV
jgi:hypothetical protein